MLEMGDPVKIVDIARDLIRLSGKEPGKDIEIVFTGLRPGEKLYEELITEGEGIVRTLHEKILVLESNEWGIYKDREGFKAWLDKKIEELTAAKLHDSKAIKRILKEIVPEYKPDTDSGPA